MRPRLLVLFFVACTAETTSPVADTAAPDTSAPMADDVTETPGDDVPAVTDAPGSDDAPAPPVPSLENNFLTEETEGRPECENLLPDDCLLPFPSDFFRREKDGQRRLDFTGGVLPVSTAGVPLSPEPLSSFDGFGLSSPILVRLPGATLAGTAPVFDAQASLAEDSKTVILDAATGERVPHWVEPDHLARLPDGELLMILRPARALDFARTYVVGIRGLVNAAGETLPPPKGFAALANQSASTYRGLQARRAGFEQRVFPPLVSAGFKRHELQLAFEFTTASESNSADLLYAVRDAVLGALPEDGPEYVIDSVEKDPSEKIGVMVKATAKVPSVLGPPDGTGLRLLRLDAQGKPVAEGFESVQFTLQIPNSVLQNPGSASVLQYGHGFLGEKTEAESGWIREFADRKGFVILAADMQGMSGEEVAIWGANVLTDAGKFPTFADKVMQGVMNHLALVKLLKGRFLEEANPDVAPGGKPVYDPTRVRYYGNSQGGTLGTLIMASSPDIERGVLGVPGCAFPFLLQRSIDFTMWEGLLRNAYDEPLGMSVVLGLLGTGFNRVEGLVHATWLREGRPGSIPHEVLLHVAKEDAQVHNEVSYLLGRRLGAPLMTPAVRPVFGLAEVPYPHTGSAVVEVDFKKPDNPHPELPPPAEHDTHRDLRDSEVGQDLLWDFLETGEVRSVCDGACDPD